MNIEAGDLFQIANAGAVQFLVPDNRLNGTIPTEFGEMSSLQKLRLDRNQLSGPIPSELGMLRSLSKRSMVHVVFEIACLF